MEEEKMFFSNITKLTVKDTRITSKTENETYEQLDVNDNNNKTKKTNDNSCELCESFLETKQNSCQRGGLKSNSTISYKCNKCYHLVRNVNVGSVSEDTRDMYEHEEEEFSANDRNDFEFQNQNKEVEDEMKKSWEQRVDGASTQYGNCNKPDQQIKEETMAHFTKVEEKDTESTIIRNTNAKPLLKFSVSAILGENREVVRVSNEILQPKHIWPYIQQSFVQHTRRYSHHSTLLTHHSITNNSTSWHPHTKLSSSGSSISDTENHTNIGAIIFASNFKFKNDNSLFHDNCVQHEIKSSEPNRMVSNNNKNVNPKNSNHYNKNSASSHIGDYSAEKIALQYSPDKHLQLDQHQQFQQQQVHCQPQQPPSHIGAFYLSQHHNSQQQEQQIQSTGQTAQHQPVIAKPIPSRPSHFLPHSLSHPHLHSLLAHCRNPYMSVGTQVFPLPPGQGFPWAHSTRGKPRRGMMRRAVFSGN